MYGRRPRCKRNLTISEACGGGHVWTAPAVQEESDYQRSVRVRSCMDGARGARGIRLPGKRSGAVMYGRRPRCKRNLTISEAFGCGHVWTAPAVQEESDYQRSVRVRSCMDGARGARGI